MARYTGPKIKLSRREGVNLNLKTNPLKTEKRLSTPPGQHGQKRSRRTSDYGIRLREKQKAKRIYGLLEKQFRRYYKQAARTSQATGEKLFELLERRLDNVVYRLGFCPTRAAARQLVTHGHVKIDQKKVNIPSYQVKPGQTITLSNKSLQNPNIQSRLSETDQIPGWLERKAAVGKITKQPQSQDLEQTIDKQLIVEYYSG